LALEKLGWSGVMFAGWRPRTRRFRQNPRKSFDDAVEYALNVAQGYLDQLAKRSISVPALDYLEIGPGADFAAQLVLSGLGAQVTLADRYLADWDPDYHPLFYRAFLDKWPGVGAGAIKAVLDRGGYDGVIRLAAEPVERMSSLANESFDFVQSNAVLEHVLDLDRAIGELARITRPGGIHAHQIDFRYHRNFAKPLDHLLADTPNYVRAFSRYNTSQGTSTRMPEMIEQFIQYFWVWDIEINAVSSPEYVGKIWHRLPPTSRYKNWALPVLAIVGGRLWLMRKDDQNRIPGEAGPPGEHHRGKHPVRRGIPTIAAGRPR
jgi:SAM-dependent methyltransferase